MGDHQITPARDRSHWAIIDLLECFLLGNSHYYLQELQGRHKLLKRLRNELGCVYVWIVEDINGEALHVVISFPSR